MASKAINVVLSLKDNLTGPLKKCASATQNVDKEVKRTANSIAKMGRSANNSFLNMSKSVGKAAVALSGLGGVLSVTALKSYASESIAMAKDQLEAETKLEAVLQNVKSLQAISPTAYKDAANELKQVASELQNVGVIGDEVALAGFQQLATFQLSQKEIGVLAEGMEDLLAQQKGLNATQSDAVSIANMIGKAMSGNASALSKVGITMSEAQVQMIKTGDATQRAAVIAEVLKENVGGVNKALAQTDQGKIQQATNAYGDMREEIGKKLLPLQAELYGMGFKMLPRLQDTILSTIDKVVLKVRALQEFAIAIYPTVQPYMMQMIGIITTLGSVVGNVIGFMAEHLNVLIPVIMGVVTGFTALNVISSVVGMFTTLTTVIKSAKTIMLAFNLVMAANPIGVVAVAIGALTAGFVYAYNNIKPFRDLMQSLWDKIKGVGNAAKGIGGVIGKALGIGGNTRRNATGTSYFAGGLTSINEGNRGEIVDLPSGTRIIPHDVATKAVGGSQTINVAVTVQGNVIGNNDYADYMGRIIAGKLTAAMANI